MNLAEIGLNSGEAHTAKIWPITGKVSEPPQGQSVSGAGTTALMRVPVLEGRKLFFSTCGFEACNSSMPLVIEARPAAEGSFGDVPPLRKKRCMVEVLPARRRAFLMLKTAIACVAMTVVTFGAVSYAAPESSAGCR